MFSTIRRAILKGVFVFGIGGTELMILLLFGFLVFGPDKMPQIAKTIGRAVKQFRTAQEQMNKVIQTEIYDPIKDLESKINPFTSVADGAEKKETKQEDKAAGNKGKEAEGATDGATKPTSAETKVSSDELVAAIAAENEIIKKKIVKPVAATVPSGSQESFAQRRARLEKEHEQAKAAKPATSATPADASEPAEIANPTSSDGEGVEKNN